MVSLWFLLSVFSYFFLFLFLLLGNCFRGTHGIEKPMESYTQLIVARLSQLERLMSIRLKRQMCKRLCMNEKLTQIDVVVIRNEIAVFAKWNSPTRRYVPNSRPVTLFKAFSDASDASRFPRNLPKLRVPVGISTFASTVYVLLVSSLCSIKYFETVSY